MARRYLQTLLHRLSLRQKIGLILLLILLYEEYYYSKLYLEYRKFYVGTYHRNIVIDRESYGKQDVHLIVIEANYEYTSEYVLPQATLKCYTAYHNYTLVNINLVKDVQYANKCPGNDFMFRRHCVLAQYMAEHPTVPWILALDADMGVINPNRLVEEYLKTKNDIVFYDRLFNYEIMAGSFILKNNAFSRGFLMDWYSYDNKVPNSYHGTDNGAIHKVLLDKFAPESLNNEAKLCMQIWNSSKDYEDLFTFESCVRQILGNRKAFKNNEGSVEIRSNLREYWTRDGWQTDNMWSDNDFLLHGWQEKRRYRIHYWAWWVSPFAREDGFQNCGDKSKNAGQNWIYKKYTYRPVEEIQERLLNVAEESYLGYLKRLEKITELRKHLS